MTAMARFKPPNLSVSLREIEMIRILFLVLLGCSITDTVLADSVKASHPYPQVIQDNDYQTIVTIETFMSQLKSGGNDSVACSNAKNIVTQAHYHNPKTSAFFTTLDRLLGELSRNETCRAVKFDQFRTLAYAKRTIVEFDFGATVVVVDAFSNGPKNEERLYTLDKVNRSESFFWGNVQ